MANRDSITISRTMGIASSTMAWPMLPSVKSWRDPRMASRIADQKVVGVVTVTATVLTSGNAPAPDARVVFTVTGANPQSPKAVTTNSAGQAVFTYVGGQAGTDTINGFRAT